MASCNRGRVEPYDNGERDSHLAATRRDVADELRGKAHWLTD